MRLRSATGSRSSSRMPNIARRTPSTCPAQRWPWATAASSRYSGRVFIGLIVAQAFGPEGFRCAEVVAEFMETHTPEGVSYRFVVAAAFHGCGLRASTKAKYVMRTAKAEKAASRPTVIPVSFSGVPKQPQLMSMCKRYARVTTARKPTMISVTALAQIRKPQPTISIRPTTISTNGRVCATTCDASGEIILYDSTCCAKLEIFIEIESLRTNIGQRCVLGIKSLENPA